MSRRTNEIGVRVTLGATRRHIVWIILRDIIVLTAVGVVIGVPLALAASGSARTLLFNLGPHDPAAMTMAVGALMPCDARRPDPGPPRRGHRSDGGDSARVRTTGERASR